MITNRYDLTTEEKQILIQVFKYIVEKIGYSDNDKETAQGIINKLVN